jgi:hypothetical protein
MAHATILPAGTWIGINREVDVVILPDGQTSILCDDTFAVSAISEQMRPENTVLIMHDPFNDAQVRLNGEPMDGVRLAGFGKPEQQG